MDRRAPKHATEMYFRWQTAAVKSALRKRLAEAISNGIHPITYAQDPFSARAALELAQEGLPSRVVFTVHYNVSMADEWELKGKIQRQDAIYGEIRRAEAYALRHSHQLTFTTTSIMHKVAHLHPGEWRSVPLVVPCFTENHAAPDLPHGPEFDLISIGTLEPRKNQISTLEILAAARQRGHRYSLTVVGDGPDRPHLERCASELNLGAQARFVGRKENARELISMHRALIHTPLAESFGIVFLEAMAAGKPIFAHPVDGIPEVFENGVHGIHLSLDKYLAADQLIATMENHSLLDALGRNGAARFQARYARDVVGAQLLSAILT